LLLIKLGTMPECSVVQKSWSELTLEELYSFIKLRTDVFFVEQQIDEDELDNRTAAYLRVLVDAQEAHLDARHSFGRVVVRADRRGEGLAQLLVARAMEQYGHESILLHSQEYIAPLYAKFGFEPFGASYIEASIPHISMYRMGR